MRLIDANELYNDIKSELKIHNSDLLGSRIIAMFLDIIEGYPETEPETLPIVKELRKQLEQSKIECESLRTVAGSLKMHLERVTEERDALKARYCTNEPCQTCLHYDNVECGGEGDCLRCKCNCPCNKCNEYSMWEWKGVHKNND